MARLRHKVRLEYARLVDQRIEGVVVFVKEVVASVQVPVRFDEVLSIAGIGKTDHDSFAVLACLHFRIGQFDLVQCPATVTRRAFRVRIGRADHQAGRSG